MSWTLLNQGSAAANAISTTELRITSSPTSAAGADLLGISTPALGAGASAGQSATLTVPTTPGTYYVWVIADNFSRVTNQSNTGNDLQHSIAFTVQAPTPPAGSSDLLPTNISLGATTVAPGGSLPVSWTLANQGTAAANSVSTTELRITSSPSSAAGTDLLGISTPALAAGGSASQNATLTVPTTPGTYYVWVIADNTSKVSNQSNTNNDLQHSIAFTVQAPSPPAGSSDLLPTGISLGSTTVAPGAPLPVSWTLLNQGGAAANAISTTELRITSSPSSAAGADLLGISTPALGAGASAGQSATLTAPTTPGTYYVWVIADNTSKVTNQSNIANDLQHSIAFTVQASTPPPPASSDLLPTNISLGATAVGPGGSLPVSWTLLNQGGAAANSSSTTELRITSSPSSAAGADLAGVSTPALAAGGSASQNVTLTAPTAPGTYYVWVIADNTSKVTNQSNTANDLQHSIAFTVQPAGPAAGAADLVPTGISLGATTLAPGAALPVSWTLANQGSGPASASSTTELRITSSPTSAAGTDLVGVATPALGGGASIGQTATLTAPTTPGTYYVWVIADNFSKVSQSNTANDLQHSVAFTVQAANNPLADLIPTNISLGSTVVAPGTPIPVSWTLANQGSGAAGATSTTELRITSSPSSAAGTDLLAINTPTLAAGASVAQGGTLTAPTTPGTYYVWVIADNFSKVSQSNTTNDLQHSIAFTVQAPASPASSDLVPDNISLSATTVAPGAPLSVTWLLANHGAAAASATSTTELRITSSPNSAAGTDLSGVATAALAGGASVGQTATLAAPTTPGTYYVWVIADNTSKVANQSNIANDLQHSVAFTVSGASGPGPGGYAFSPASPTVSENAGVLSFTLTRANTASAATVYVSTVQDQGARNSGFYTGPDNQPVVFAANQASATVTVAVHDLGLTSGQETFRIIAQDNPNAPVSVSLASSNFTILNNDSPALSLVSGMQQPAAHLSAPTSAAGAAGSPLSTLLSQVDFVKDQNDALIGLTQLLDNFAKANGGALLTKNQSATLDLASQIDTLIAMVHGAYELGDGLGSRSPDEVLNGVLDLEENGLSMVATAKGVAGAGTLQAVIDQARNIHDAYASHDIYTELLALDNAAVVLAFGGIGALIAFRDGGNVVQGADTGVALGQAVFDQAQAAGTFLGGWLSDEWASHPAWSAAFQSGGVGGLASAMTADLVSALPAGAQSLFTISSGGKSLLAPNHAGGGAALAGAPTDLQFDNPFDALSAALAIAAAVLAGSGPDQASVVQREYAALARTPLAPDLTQSLAAAVTAGTETQDQMVQGFVQQVAATSSVAVLAYQFFTGAAPGSAGMDYLVSPTGPNPNNLNSAYYQAFTLENRYINFAVNLGKLGEGAGNFSANYGALDLFNATRKAYGVIFGGVPSQDKVHAILDATFTVNGATMTRADYFAYYGGDGLDGQGTKAAMVGWLLSEAVKADLGTYAHSNDAFLTDVALHNAPFAVDIIGHYNQPAYAYAPG